MNAFLALLTADRSFCSGCRFGILFCIMAFARPACAQTYKNEPPRKWIDGRRSQIEEAEVAKSFSTLAMSPQGKHVVALAYEGNVWFSKPPFRNICLAEEFVFNGTHALAACYSQDGRRLLLAGPDRAGNGGSILVYNVANDTILHRWKVAESHIVAVDISNDEKTLVTATARNDFYQIDYRSMSDGQSKYSNQGNGNLAGVAFTVDHRAMAAVGRLPISLTKGRWGEEVDSDLGFVAVWDLQAHRLKWHKILLGQQGMTAAFSPDGKMLATSSRGLQVFLWNTASGDSLAVLQSSDLFAQSLAFSPDSKFLAVGSRKKVILYDVSERKPKVHSTREIDQNIVHGLAFTSAGTKLEAVRELKKSLRKRPKSRLLAQPLSCCDRGCPSLLDASVIWYNCGYRLNKKVAASSLLLTGDAVTGASKRLCENSRNP